LLPQLFDAARVCADECGCEFFTTWEVIWVRSKTSQKIPPQIVDKGRGGLQAVIVPPMIAQGMKPYREIFCRREGFEHVSRYVSGLLLCENKTLQGIYAQQVWPEGEAVSRRVMQAGVFEAGGSSDELMVQHRAQVAPEHRGGRGREVIGVDWTLAHHERGPKIGSVIQQLIRSRL
jgi:hypothetical protein